MGEHETVATNDALPAINIAIVHERMAWNHRDGVDEAVRQTNAALEANSGRLRKPLVTMSQVQAFYEAADLEGYASIDDLIHGFAAIGFEVSQP